MARLACPRCARSGGVRAAGGVRSTEVFERAMIGAVAGADRRLIDAVAGLIDAVPEGEGGASHNRSSGNDPNRSYRPRVFLARPRTRPGSGAMHLGAKYPDRFAALVISSGPIVFDAYPFDRLKGKVGLMVIHGDQDTTNPIEASRRTADAAKAAGIDTVYATVPGGTHLAAYLTYASEIFDFLDGQKK